LLDIAGLAANNPHLTDAGLEAIVAKKTARLCAKVAEAGLVVFLLALLLQGLIESGK